MFGKLNIDNRRFMLQGKEDKSFWIWGLKTVG
jgi:hypothetical protein